MKRLIVFLLGLVGLTNGQMMMNQQQVYPVSLSNSCIQFTVGQGTGCSWMCNYCATQLQTTNYYFTDSVCTYQEGGCVGNPIAGKTYTCCSL